jgi:hypothetical protein
LRNTVLIILGLLIVLVLLVNTTPVQNYIARKATEVLSDKLKTKVTLQHIRIDFLNHLLVQGLYVEDQKHDTLLYAGEAQMRITDWFFFKKEVPVLNYVGLKNAFIRLDRKSNSKDWNYDFVIDAFSTPKSTTKKQNDFQVDLKKVNLENIRFRMDDAWTGNDLDIDAGSLVLNANDLDLKKKVLKLNNIAIGNASVYIGSYPGGKPKKAKRKIDVIDTTAFNPGLWAVNADKLSLSNCAFNLKSDEVEPTPEEFDPTHIVISEINIEANKISIKGDTIRGHIAHLGAKERCGIVVKKFEADVEVSPNASICDNMYLETNNSKLKRYYAMRYTRFPDFTDYIRKVRMVGELNESTVDAKDIAYFAPALRDLYPAVVRISGSFDGTVDRFVAENLDVNDGITSVKGDLGMTGLPDIYNTFIDYSKGEIRTSGFGIMRYAPSLQGSPDIALEKLVFANFAGSYTGFIDRFVANGKLNTNLGNITSNIRLNVSVAGKKELASYEGKVTADNFLIGSLLRQPLLGSVTLTADVKGKGFKAENADLTFSTNISQLGLNNYNYQKITADGTLANKKFDGNLIVDDPNLALAFNGAVDFSQQKQLSLNAKANLLQSNLQALNITKDSVLASADFDLNCTGSNIDNFTGYAKLFNINLIRNNRHLDVDSVFIQNQVIAAGRALSIESNDVTAYLQGNFQLSSLAYSAQMYLYGYLPNYIPPPKKEAPNQDISFNVQTRRIDSLLGVLFPAIKGFDNSVLTGSLNTNAQTLRLNANVPFGKIGIVSMNRIVLTGEGNYRSLSLNGDIGNINIGDSILNVSLNANAKLGNDSLSFNILTSSPDNYGTATINGNAHARGDSLYLSFMPSEFYLNQNRWEIPAGNRFVIGKQYINVKDFVLKSGLQQLSLNSEETGSRQAYHIVLHDIDMAQMGVITGFGDYQPDGRINGNINAEDIFGKLKADARIEATDVKMGIDTIGQIILAGNYDGTKNELILDKGSGITYKNASLSTYGTFGLSQSEYVDLDGHIEFNNSRLVWITPLVKGFVSQLGGGLNGSIKIKGTSLQPDISGTVSLNNAAVHVDYLGTNYTIKNTDLSIDNQQVKLGNVTVYDQYKNPATLSGSIKHNRLKNFVLALSLTSEKFEALNLQDFENKDFYGHLLAQVQSLSVRGPVNDITMNIKATPAGPSHLYLPVKSGGDLGSYSYVSFKTYGEEQKKIKVRGRNKFSINIVAATTPDLTMTMILDASTGDEINAKGTGNINLEFGSGNDIRIAGNYNIDQGDYTFTFRQLFFKRNFIINSGSTINFGGSLSKTTLNINGTYRTTARLYDLLSESEKTSNIIPASELTDTKTAQNVDVILKMTGMLQKPDLTFKLELPEKRSVGTYAYTKLDKINQSDRELFDQVASLLLVGSFIPPEGLVGTTARTGAINNMSELISSTASSQLTNIVNKLLGDKTLQIELKYKNYNLSDPTIEGGINRNEFRFGLRQSLFKERVIVELGSAYDWGRPTGGTSTAPTSNFNLAGDFRLQYLITEDGRLRFNLFRTSNYDVLVDKNVSRNGTGISWRKTFDNFDEFLHSKKYYQNQQKKIQQGNMNTDSTTIRKAEGTD